MSDVPKDDAEASFDSGKEYEKIEANMLTTDSISSYWWKRNISQRYWLRWTAFVIAVGVIGVMFWFVLKVYGDRELLKSSATFVAPIISMTAITISLLIVAFGRKKDNLDVAKDLTSGVVSASQQ